MTASDIVARLFSAKGVTADRVKKAKGLAMRAKVDWLDVVIAMSPEQRQQVDAIG
jgi:hypothetical protein